ncbi:MAG: hypothetical protein HY515_01150 [Candidatus Aenigmarchaeota archaeon]|nr:hypothetical protein [Candidatus Aenigmarchaeota archaeon]
MVVSTTNMQNELFSTAVANASSANLKAGFDHLAVELEGLEQPLQNKVMVRLSGKPKEITVQESFDSTVPLRWERNCASRAAVKGVIKKQLPELIEDFGLYFATETLIPNPAGMGSSGASAAAGMKAGLRLVKKYIRNFAFSPRQQIEAAVVGETARHYDNVSASVLGGLAEKIGDDFRKHKVPEWYVLLAKPVGVTKGSTAKGRGLLSDDDKEQYEYGKSIVIARRAIVNGLRGGDLIGLAQTMAQFEDPVERIRAENGFYGAGITARFLGAIYHRLAQDSMAAWVSGAGPYVLAVVGYDRNRLELAKRIFSQSYEPLGYKPQFIEARLSNQGARNV